jgi:hypothetical protein
MHDMSPRERSAWIRLASILIVFVPYFLHVLRLFESDGPIGRRVCIAFIVAAIAHAILNGVAQAIDRIAFGARRTDERDAAIDAISLRVAYFSLTSLVLLALSTMAFLGAIAPVSATGRILLPGFALTSQFVLFCCVAAEVARHATQLACYRREASS